jgi:glycosyltransferase involved in cell wall biosynthesis
LKSRKLFPVLAIDLTSFDFRFDLGVGRYIEGILRGFNQIKSKDINVVLLISEDSKLPTHTYLDKFEKIYIKKNKKKARIVLGLFLLFLVYGTRAMKLLRRFEYSKSLKIIENSCDVIYVPTTYLNFYTSKVPIIVSLHDVQSFSIPENFSLVLRIKRYFNTKYTIHYASIVQASSYFIKNEIIKFFGTKFENKIRVIPEGVFVPRNLISKKSNNSFQIFMPAYFWKHKNHQVLFRAVELLPPNLDLKIRLTISASDAIKCKYRPPNNNQDYIEFLGRLDSKKLLRLYRDSHYVLSCSAYESSSLPILEGFANGCKVLASNIPAHTEMLSGFKAEIFESGDHIYLARSLFKIYSKYQPKFLKSTQLQSINNYHHVKKFSWSKIADKYKGLSLSLLSDN